MKLIKLKNDHYIVVDDSEIKEGDWMYNPEREPSLLQCIGKGSIRGWKKITHSTQPIEIIHTSGVTMTNPPMGFINIIELPLSEVKELIGEVDVLQESKNYVLSKFKSDTDLEQLNCYKHIETYILGYNQALEDNKEKKYTEEDVIYIIDNISGNWFKCYSEKDKKEHLLKIAKQLQKTEWEVEFIDGKLKLR